MTSIDSLQRWVAFVPDIGNNKSLPSDKQLVLEVASGLTKEQLLKFQEDLNAAPKEGETPDDARIRVLSEHLRLVGGPHQLGGRIVSTISDYVRVCIDLSGHYNLREVFAAVGYFNSFPASDALFSERLSGGTAFTLHQGAANEAP